MIELDHKTGVIEVNGAEDKVAKARQVIQQIINEHQATSFTMQVHVPSAAFPLVIGTKGSKASEISQTSGAKFDLDRTQELAHLKGSPEACQIAADMIRELLLRAGFVSPNASNATTKVKDHAAHPITTSSPIISDGNRITESEEQGEDHPNTEELRKNGTITAIPEAARAKIPVGATPAMAAMARMQHVPMSKSAARRKRRKEQVQGTGADDDDSDDNDDDVDVILPPTESTSSSSPSSPSSSALSAIVNAALSLPSLPSLPAMVITNNSNLPKLPPSLTDMSTSALTATATENTHFASHDYAHTPLGANSAYLQLLLSVNYSN